MAVQIRSPKSKRPKEYRSPKPEPASVLAARCPSRQPLGLRLFSFAQCRLNHCRLGKDRLSPRVEALDFGFRVPDFFRISTFGFRIFLSRTSAANIQESHFVGHTSSGFPLRIPSLDRIENLGANWGMSTYRVKSAQFAATEFEPANNKPRVLRWFQRETPYQYLLHVEDAQADGTYVLRARAAFRQPFAPEKNAGPAGMVVDSLDQATVDKIERPQTSALTRLCDFVIFQDSPKAAARFKSKGE